MCALYPIKVTIANFKMNNFTPRWKGLRYYRIIQITFQYTGIEAP